MIGIHYTHILLAFIWGIVVISVTAIELYYLVKSGTSITYLVVYAIVIQNLGIASANSYYLSKMGMSASATGITASQTTTQGKVG